jgi:hypothetical protein
VTTVAYTITFPQYVAAARLYALNTTLRQKIGYIVYLYVLPILAAFALPVALWVFIANVKSPGGDDVSMGIALGIVLTIPYFLFNPRRFRARMRKLYKSHSHDLPHTVEFSSDGIRSIIPGILDAHFEWAFFNTFMETDDLLLLLIRQRASFVVAAKSNLDATQQAELSALLAAHLKQISL